MIEEPSVKGFFDLLERLLVILGVAFTLIMLVVLTLQIIMRYLFDIPLSWSEEVAMLLFSWVVVIGCTLALRSKSHASIELFLNVMPEILRNLCQRIICCITLAVGLYIINAGFDYLMMTRGDRSAAIRYPIEVLQISAPFFGILISVFSIEGIVLPRRDK